MNNLSMQSTQAMFDRLFPQITTPPKSHDAEVKSGGISAGVSIVGTQASGLSCLLTLEQCRTVALSLHAALKVHKRLNPDSSAIDESERFARGIVLNLEGAIHDQNNYEAHPHRCPCDSCAAARSDEHFDRKRDGEAADTLHAYEGNR